MGSVIAPSLRKLIGNVEVRIIMVGLDGTGKTTLLYKLKLGEIVTTIPTIGFNVETVQYKNIGFTVWDLSSRDKVRPLWRHFFQDTQGIVFVVDSHDRQRLEEASLELQKLLREDEIRDAVILVFANKQDLPNPLSVEEIIDGMGLKYLRSRVWHVQPAVATTGEGLYEGLDWFSNALALNESKSGLSTLVSSFTNWLYPTESSQSSSVSSSVLSQSSSVSSSVLSQSSSISPPLLPRSSHSTSEKLLPPETTILPSDKNKLIEEPPTEQNVPVLVQMSKPTSNINLQSLNPYLANKKDVRSKSSDYPSDSFKEFPSDEIFLKAFESADVNLVKIWNHLIFLRVIWLHLTMTGRKEGVKLILDGYKNFCEKSNRVFHMTISYFWIQIIDYCLAKGKKEKITTTTTNDSSGVKSESSEILLRKFWEENSFALDSELFLQYYSKNIIFHKPESMTEFCLPNLKPLPAIVSFKS